MIIAIDGPAASGKGTLARRLAAHFGFRHLDTGLLYRAVAAELLNRSLPLDDEAKATEIADQLDVTALDRDRLSTHDVGEAASKVAVMPMVRAALVKLQRDFAATPPGAVLDGRDIATVICPDADVKLFVTASAEVRARRRTDEQISRKLPADFDAVLADLIKRDERDAGRDVAPMKQSADAHLLDTSEMDIETAFRKAVDIVDSI
jgi:CMP/dCMP kinase